MKAIIQFIFPFWKKYLWQEGILITSLLLSFVLSMVIPLQFKGIIDSLTQYSLKSQFYTVLLTYTVIIFLKSLNSWFFGYFTTYVGESFIIDVTSTLYTKILHQRRNFWEKYYPNDVLTRLTQDVVSVKSFLYDFLHNLFLQVISIISIWIVLVIISPAIGVLILIQGILTFIIIQKGNSFLSYRGALIRKISSRFTQLFQTGIANPSQNFSWNLVPYHLKRYRANAKNMRREQILFTNHIQIISQIIGVVNLICGTLITLSILRDDFVTGRITIGGLFAVIMYSNSAVQSVSKLAESIISTKISRVSVIRIRELLQYENAVRELSLTSKIHHPFFQNEIQNGIILPEKEKYVYILKGSNGCGKTTFANIMGGFDDLNQSALLEPWFVLPSDFALFEGDLLENIQIISGLNVSSSEVSHLLEQNGLTRLLDLFPKEFSTQVVGNSECVSRGQRQVIGLMAAVVKNPSAIICDESINSIDPQMKNDIKHPLLGWLINRRSVIIDHDNYFADVLDIYGSHIFSGEK